MPAPLEFKLLVECCRRTFDDEGKPLSTDAFAVDWQLFHRLIQFHRVSGLVWTCISRTEMSVPSEINAAIATQAQATIASNLKIALECLALRTDFEQAGVPLLFVKGLTVGALGYPNPFIKSGWDIDFLVPADKVRAAAMLLQERGYQLSQPPGNSTRIEAWHRVHKESTWRRVGEGLNVELHTRLADSRELIPTVGIDSPTQLVQIAPGVILPTLGLDHLFAYLCVHGASSAWFRLKWITDLAALLHGRSGAEVERLYHRSQELGAGRGAGQALLLADTLFETLDRSSGLRASLNADRGSRWLCRQALQQLAGKREPSEPTGRPGGTLRIHATQLFLMRGLGFKVSEVMRQARAAATR